MVHTSVGAAGTFGIGDTLNQTNSGVVDSHTWSQQFNTVITVDWGKR